jgi:hypothetical protein
MFLRSRQVLDIALTKVHNTLRFPQIIYSESTIYCTKQTLYIQDVVC